MNVRIEIEERLKSGVPIEKVFFEYGFKACIDSVHRKGHVDLAYILEQEHAKIEKLINW